MVKSFFKEETYRSEEYLNFIRSLPCLIEDRNCFSQIAPHHIEARATCSDLWTLPLCCGHHTGDNGIHRGKETFERRYGLNIDREVMKLNKQYIIKLKGVG